MKKLMLCACFFTIVACGPSLKTRRVSLNEGDDLAQSITDKWVATDTKNAVNDMLAKMETHKGFQRYLAKYNMRGNRPRIFISEVQNDTAEAYFPIDDMNDELLTKISEEGIFTLIDASARQKILKEITYQNDGMVDPRQVKSIGKQTGADLIIFGAVRMKPETFDGKTIKEYSVNLRMTDVETGEEVWRARYQTSKYSKRSGSGW